MHFLLIIHAAELNTICPHCDGNNLILTRYEVTLRILKDRIGITSSDCYFEIEVDKFKKQLWYV